MGLEYSQTESEDNVNQWNWFQLFLTFVILETYWYSWGSISERRMLPEWNGMEWMEKGERWYTEAVNNEGMKTEQIQGHTELRLNLKNLSCGNNTITSIIYCISSTRHLGESHVNQAQKSDRSIQ